MPTIFPLFLVFLLVPLAEIYVLIKVGSVIGAGATILFVVLTAVLGAALVRLEGLSTLQRAQLALQRGEVPAMELVEGMILLVAGALLLTPGFVTDAVGFLCLVPPLRRHVIRAMLYQRLTVRVSSRRGDSGNSRRGPAAGQRHNNTIEGDFERLDK